MFPTIGTKPVFYKNGLQFLYSNPIQAAVQGLIIHITHNQGKKKRKTVSGWKQSLNIVSELPS